MKLYKMDLQLFAGNINTIGNSGTGYNELAAEDAIIYDDAMFERLIPELQWFSMAKKKTLSGNKGTTLSMRRFETLGLATTQITEGVIPDGADITMVTRTAQVGQYGNYVRTTEFLGLVGLDDTILELSELLGENAGQSIDIIVRDVVLAGSNVTYANSVLSRVTVASNITYNDILRLARTMKVNKVKKMTLENKKRGYVMLVDPYVAYDVKQLEEYKRYNESDNSENLRMGIIADLGGLLFKEIDNGKVESAAGAADIDVHLSCVLGENAYCVPDIEGKSKPAIIVQAAGSGGSVGDPLKQISSVGWKATFATLRVEELAIIRYESAATDA